MKPRVFVPQIPTRYDTALRRTVPKFEGLDKAERFGELVVLLDRNNDVWDPAACILKLSKGLLTFSESDFLLPMGSHHFMMWTAMVLTSRKANPIRTLQTLQWHSRNEEYVVLQTAIIQ